MPQQKNKIKGQQRKNGRKLQVCFEKFRLFGGECALEKCEMCEKVNRKMKV
jgi:hypothetical protein